MSKICFLIVSALVLAVAGFAQDVAQAPETIGFAQEVAPPPGVMVLQKTPEPLHAEPGTLMVFQNGPGAPDNAIYLREMIGGGEPIKGAPYTATAVTESTQVLGDGNRIVHKSSTFVARDSQGRTRREENFGEVGGLLVNSGKVYFISDPTTGTDYVLNPDEQAARVVKREGWLREEPQGLMRKKHIEEQLQRVPGGTSGEFKHESLGTQVIEGVSCEGNRETKVIPAGAIGNERPMEITSESWFSTDLHVLVLRKRNDPRLGETVYRLTNIKLGEPDASLFQVPGGYKTTVVSEPRRSRE